MKRMKAAVQSQGKVKTPAKETPASQRDSRTGDKKAVASSSRRSKNEPAKTQEASLKKTLKQSDRKISDSSQTVPSKTAAEKSKMPSKPLRAGKAAVKDQAGKNAATMGPASKSLKKNNSIKESSSLLSEKSTKVQKKIEKGTPLQPQNSAAEKIPAGKKV